MLKGIHPLLTADLLHVLAAMGHGDEIAIVDANFPSARVGRRVIQLAGASSPEVLAAVLTVFPLDTDAIPAAFTMAVIGDPDALPEAVADFAACSQTAASPIARSAASSATNSTSARRAPPPWSEAANCVRMATSC
jgi:L-fucose mutarotase